MNLNHRDVGRPQREQRRSAARKKTSGLTNANPEVRHG